jgi:transcriptional regulator NrdR family protein
VICPECSSKMACNQTKNYVDPEYGFNYVERRRICTECGHRMMTVEVSQEEFSRRRNVSTVETVG